MCDYLLYLLGLIGIIQLSLIAPIVPDNLAAHHARNLVQNNNKGAIALFYHKNTTYSYASIENYDGSNGDKIIFIFDEMSVTKKNLMTNQHGSFVVTSNNCTGDNLHICPRVTFIGKFQPLIFNSTNDHVNMEPFFDIIKNEIWTLDIHEIHYIGDNNGTHYNGEIPINDYLEIF